MSDLRTYNLALAPGINKAETVWSQRGQTAQGLITGRYIDADKVRFFNSLPEKIGGCPQNQTGGKVSVMTGPGSA